MDKPWIDGQTHEFRYATALLINRFDHIPPLNHSFLW